MKKDKQSDDTIVSTKLNGIGVAIKKLRGQEKQVEFAKKCGISSCYLSQLESGERKPSIELIERISQISEVPLEVFYFLSIQEDNIKNEEFRNAKATIDILLQKIFLKGGLTPRGTTI